MFSVALTVALGNRTRVGSLFGHHDTGEEKPSLLWLVSSHRPGQALTTMFLHQLCCSFFVFNNQSFDEGVAITTLQQSWQLKWRWSFWKLVVCFTHWTLTAFIQQTKRAFNWNEDEPHLSIDECKDINSHLTAKCFLKCIPGSACERIKTNSVFLHGVIFQLTAVLWQCCHRGLEKKKNYSICNSHVWNESKWNCYIWETWVWTTTLHRYLK